jgi:hypothetical protein
VSQVVEEFAHAVLAREWRTEQGIRYPEENRTSTMRHSLSLRLLPGAYAVCRLPADAASPSWPDGDFVSITRTMEELAVVCREETVPEDIRREVGWRCLRVEGTLDFSLVGVLASLVGPLADAGVSVFVTSTFDTDYLMVRQADLERSTEALRAAGHRVGE